MIGERVKMLRERLGQNQSKFAQQGGFSQGFLSAVEKEQKVPGAAFLQSLRRYFDANVNWVLTGEGEMFEGEMPGSQHAGDLDKELVRAVIEAVEEGLGDLHLELKPDKKAQLVITLCEMFEEEMQVDKPTILRLIRLAA